MPFSSLLNGIAVFSKKYKEKYILRSKLQTSTSNFKIQSIFLENGRAKINYSIRVAC